MRNLSKIALCLLTAGITASAGAADLIIDGSVVPGNEITTISIDPDTGNVEVNTSTGYIVTTGDGEPPPPPPPPPPPLDFDAALTVSKNDAVLGDSVLFTWTSTGASYCEARGGTNAWRANGVNLGTSGSRQFTMDKLGDVKFRMVCFDGQGGERWRPQTISISSTPAPDNNAVCPTPKLTASPTVTWFDLWGGYAWPDSAGNRDIAIGSPTKVKPIRFDTGTYDGSGAFITIETTRTPGAIRRAAISECPGILDVAPECDQTWGDGNVLQWSTNGKAGVCQLEKGKVYYMNLTFVLDENAASLESTCNAGLFTTCYMTLNANAD